jgi:ubiquinone/menaquinone biosynthesis C-methylase UbiE
MIPAPTSRLEIDKGWMIMTNQQEKYLLSQAPDEVTRLQSWAHSWEPETEALLDRVQVQHGWRCLDLACGPLGILGSLSRRVGSRGIVVGADSNTAMLSAALCYIRDNKLKNVELVEADAFESRLPPASFDLVHARFLLAPLGREEEFIKEMIALTSPGGVIVSQESDESGYIADPPQPAWEKLKQLTIAAFGKGGGNYSAGRKMYGLMKHAGLEDVQARTAVLALPVGHPFRMWPLESAKALRPKLLEWGLIAEPELNSLLRECEGIARDPDIFLTSFAVMQVWGRKAKLPPRE